MSDYNRDQLEALLMVQRHLEGLLLKEKRFTWPDKPVHFDELEELFLQTGLKSPLMYCHLSPGLRRVKAQRRRG